MLEILLKVIPSHIVLVLQLVFLVLELMLKFTKTSNTPNHF